LGAVHCQSREVFQIATNLASVFYDARDTLLQYVAQNKTLVKRLLRIISESLGLEEEYIENNCGEDARVLMAINHYPPCPDPSLTIGIRAHSDPNTITILLQDQVAGLQIQKDGEWFSAQALEGSLIINVGDHLQVHRRTCPSVPLLHSSEYLMDPLGISFIFSLACMNDFGANIKLKAFAPALSYNVIFANLYVSMIADAEQWEIPELFAPSRHQQGVSTDIRCSFLLTVSLCSHQACSSSGR
jgi:hypothetical protein